MPGVSRDSRVDSAGGPIIEGSPDVFTNLAPTVRKGDAVEGHGTGPHSSPVMEGCSTTVFANNIGVVRAGDAATCGHPATGSDNVFSGDTVSTPPATSSIVVLDSPQATGQQPDTRLPEIISNPDKFYKPENEQSGAKPNFPGTPPNTETVVDPEPPIVCKGGGLSVLPFLQKCLAEAKTGVWRETGQGGAPSNPNILNMWKNIGLGYSSDQVPWCAGFACFALKQSGMKFIKEAGAANLVNRCAEYEGKLINPREMQPGDLVYWSSSHVSFVYTYSGGKYTFVGGNQLPGKGSSPPIRDPKNDGDVTVSWASGWTFDRGGISKVVRINC